jgi:signal transduction histidine kinase
LREVVSNLFLNAVEAMETTVDRHRVLRVTTELRKRDTIAVTVEDSGPGISPRHLANLFRALHTTKPQGSGLGLAISQTIVEEHGGQIMASSDQKSGAVFQVLLPIRPDIGTASATAN